MITAITGGIGSGKSYVSALLQKYGVMVYDCDKEAKLLMNTDEVLRQQLCQLVGLSVYEHDKLNKSVLARFILEGEAHKQAVNNIVHPAVARHFLSSGYQWLESAILFESGFITRVQIDRVVCVTAAYDVRVKRIMQRDGITASQAKAWIDCQMPQEKMAMLSDVVLVNDEESDIDRQVAQLVAASKE